MKKYIYSTIALLSAIAIFGIFTLNSNAAEEKNKQVLAVKTVSKAQKDKYIDFTYIEDGIEKSFSDLAKGKVVFLNFWGTWCPPCRAEIPDIMKIQEKLSENNVLVVGIAMEKSTTKDKLARVKNFHSKNKMNYLNFVDVDNKLNSGYGGIRAVPTTLIINKEGSIIEIIQGMKSYEAFLESINKVL